MVLETVAIAAILAAPGLGVSSEPDSLLPELELFRPFLGKTYRGTFEGTEHATPMHDISRWERALNGRAIRILHSLNGGEYGGESIIMWDREKGCLAFHYFTTAGFWTQGTITPQDSGFTGHELVSGNSQGVTEVRSVSEIPTDGRMRTRSEYLKNGQWVPGHSINYVEDPSAQVIFR